MIHQTPLFRFKDSTLYKVNEARSFLISFDHDFFFEVSGKLVLTFELLKNGATMKTLKDVTSIDEKDLVSFLQFLMDWGLLEGSPTGSGPMAFALDHSNISVNQIEVVNQEIYAVEKIGMEDNNDTLQ